VTAGGAPLRALVGVDGADGSGKSRFAEALATACAAEGTPAALVHVDDFRRPVDFAAAADPAAEAALYYDRYYDFEALEACLRAYLAGAAALAVPRFDPASGTLAGTQELRFGDAPLCVVEGVLLLRAPSAAAAPLVLLEVTAPEARRRVLARDAARGRAPAEIERRLSHRYLPAQARYRAAFDPAGQAAAVVDNDRWDRPRLLRREASRLPAMRRLPAAVDRALARMIPS
jgi:uridine kinase